MFSMAIEQEVSEHARPNLDSLRIFTSHKLCIPTISTFYRIT